MKKNLRTSSMLFAAVLCLVTLLTCNASALVTLDTTAGHMALDVPPGKTLLSLPLQNPAVYEGNIQGVDGNRVGADFGSLGQDRLYLQVIESDNAFGRYETITGTSQTMVELSAPISGLAPGDRVVIRRLFALADILATPGFASGTTLTTYDAQGAKQAFTWTGDGQDSGYWTDGSGQDASGVVIRPGQGMLIHNMDIGPRQIHTGGEVLADSLKPLALTGFSLAGSSSVSDGTTLAQIFSYLPDRSTITVYSADGSLSRGRVYTVYDTGSERIYMRDGRSAGGSDTIDSGLGLVIVPGSPGEHPLPAAGGMAEASAFVTDIEIGKIFDSQGAVAARDQGRTLDNRDNLSVFLGRTGDLAAFQAAIEEFKRLYGDGEGNLAQALSHLNDTLAGMTWEAVSQSSGIFDTSLNLDFHSSNSPVTGSAGDAPVLLVTTAATVDTIRAEDQIGIMASSGTTLPDMGTIALSFDAPAFAWDTAMIGTGTNDLTMMEISSAHVVPHSVPAAHPLVLIILSGLILLAGAAKLRAGKRAGV